MEDLDAKMRQMANAAIEMVDDSRRMIKAQIMGALLQGAALKLDGLGDDQVNAVVGTAESIANKILKRCGVE